MQRTHDELKELIAPFALGAVPAEEEAEIRAHLRTCAECRAAARDFEDVAASIATTVAPVEVPEGFADRTMERVRGGRPATEHVPLRRRWAPAWMLASAALAVACAVLAASLVATRSDVDSQREVVAALLEDPALRLQGAGASAAVVSIEGSPMLVTGEMGAPPEGKVYQLWRMSAGCDPATGGDCSYESGGLIDPDDPGTPQEIRGSLSDYEEAAVTVEDREVEDPTCEPVMASFEI